MGQRKALAGGLPGLDFQDVAMHHQAFREVLRAPASTTTPASGSYCWRSTERTAAGTVCARLKAGTTTETSGCFMGSPRQYAVSRRRSAEARRGRRPGGRPAMVDARPAIPVFDPVHQHHAAALAAPKLLRGVGVVHDPVVPRAVGHDPVVPRRPPGVARFED